MSRQPSAVSFQPSADSLQLHRLLVASPSPAAVASHRRRLCRQSRLSHLSRLTPAPIPTPNIHLTNSHSGLIVYDCAPANPEDSQLSKVFDRLKQALAGRYHIEREVGRGGMALVYLAQDLRHNRRVAVKVLRPQLAATLGADRFLEEIQIAAGLSHPHILPLFDSGEADGFVYYVMPFVEGESLRDLLDREKRLPVDEALKIARDIADGLGYAHGQGVIHQDIKPDNILLLSGHAVIADFGVAGAVSAAGVNGVAHSGRTGGTPEYGSPEQVTGDNLDGRTDLYSLGCVLYEMLAGELPHTGPTAQAIMTSRIKHPAPCITEERDDIPEHVAEALGTMLARAPTERFQSASELIASLPPSAEQPEWVRGPSGPYLVAAVFVVSSLVVLTLTSILVNVLELPDWVLPGVVLLLVIGFPIIIATTLVQRGTIRPPPVARPLLTWRRAIAGGVIALAAWGAAVTGIVAFRAPAATIDTSAIAVLPLRVIGQEAQDMADSSLFHVANDAATMIAQGIMESGRGTVIPLTPSAVDDAAAQTRQDQHALARQLGASLLITGWLHRDGDSLFLEARLTDLRTDRMLDAVGPVVGPAASPMQSAHMLRQQVISSLVALVGADTAPSGSR